MVGLDTYHFYYDAVRVGIVCEQMRVGETLWTWQCGFYPGAPIREHRIGEAPTLEFACAAFKQAWTEYLPRRTPAEFAAWHADRRGHRRA